MASSEEFAPQGFAQLIGTAWVSFDPDEARATIEVREDHLQPYGVVHGGVYASLAESLTSAATNAAVKDDDMVAMGMANNTSFLRPIREGRIEAVARPRSRGKTTWVWDVEIVDSEGRVCALSRMTIAVRPLRR
ncbi:MAG: PaaI family thioesterase [Solirubrobacterales bacterium]|nr:PaaI family thioesterase [Solirubrobacterales bacterium]